MGARLSHHLLNGLTAAMTVAAVTVGVIKVRSMRAQSAAPGGSPVPIANWRTFMRSGHRLGADTAPVTIVLFADFQCPFCRQATNVLRDIRRRYPGQVAVLYRHYPLSSHAYARRAALAAICAAKQGAFEAYHDQLFAHQDSIGTIGWTTFAEAAGVGDLAAFRQCIENPIAAATIADDSAAAASLGSAAHRPC